MQKNLLRSIQRSLTRYLAIAMIIALGAALFVGLLATKTDMIATGQAYLDQQNMFDLRLLNAYGWSDEELAEISKLDGVADAEGIILDVYTIDPVTGIGTEADGTEVNLPQTGISVVYNYIMLAAAAMVLFGIYAMAKSRKRDEE